MKHTISQVISCTALLALGVASLDPTVAVAQRAKRAARITQSLPVIVRDSLPNGMKLVFARSNDVPLVELNLIVRSGASQDPVGKEGLATLASRLMLQGGDKRVDGELQDQLAGQATIMSSFTAAEYTQFYARALSKNLRQTLDVLAEVTCKPAFPYWAVKREKTRMQAEGASDGEPAGERASRALFRAMYGPEHALLRKPFGSISSLSAITTDDVRAFHQTHFLPNNTTLIVTGNVDPAQLKALVLERFSAWRSGVVAPAPSTQPEYPQGGLVIVEDTLTKLPPCRFALRGPARNDAHVHALLVLDQILGTDEESRLFRMFWGRHFVHPSFQSAIVFSGSSSAFLVTGSAPAWMADSVQIFVGQVFREIIEKGVSPAELARAKQALTEDYPFGFSTNRRLQTLLQEMVVFNEPPEYVLRFADKVNAVSVNDVKAVARSIFENAPSWLVTLGNPQKIEAAVRATFGEKIHVIR